MKIIFSTFLTFFKDDIMTHGPWPAVECIVFGGCVNRRFTSAHEVKRNLTFSFTEYGTADLLVCAHRPWLCGFAQFGLPREGSLFPPLHTYVTLTCGRQSVCPPGYALVSSTDKLQGSKDCHLNSNRLAVFQGLLVGNFIWLLWQVRVSGQWDCSRKWDPWNKGSTDGINKTHQLWSQIWKKTGKRYSEYYNGSP